MQDKIFGLSRWAFVSHPKPDGDAVGAILGLYHLYRALGKEAYPILPDKPPSYLAFLPGFELIHVYEESPENVIKLIAECEGAFCVDFGFLGRLPALMAEILAKKLLIHIDHHPDAEAFGVYNELDTEASATCEILYLWAKAQRLALPKETLICWYTGIQTDTGGLRQRNVRLETFAVVHQMVQEGVPYEKIHYHLYHQRSFLQVQLQSFLVQHRMVYLPSYHAVIVSVYRADLEQFGASYEEVEFLVGHLLTLKGVMVAIVLKEYPHAIRLSFRSLGDIAVNQWAKTFDQGGGHKNAAGATAHTTDMVAIQEKVRTLLHQYAQDLDRAYRDWMAWVQLSPISDPQK
ncbi:MAG: DHH family phosphoesterase [Bacteroidia bacterium]